LDRVLATNASAMTPIVAGLTRDILSAQTPPSSVVFSPAWLDYESNYGVGLELQERNTTGRAMCAMGFHWSTVLEDALPRTIVSAVVVLQGPDGASHTFRWDDGVVADAGGGDRHAMLVTKRELQQRARTITVVAAGQNWTVTLFATPALEKHYITARPRNTALAVVAASIACVLLFGYDARRNNCAAHLARADDAA
jgi:hypothetical protein